MSKKRVCGVRLAVACVAVLTLAVAPAEANLIVNGSFETPVVPVGGTAVYGAGSTAITGWTVVGVGSDSVGLVSTSFAQSGVTFNAQNGQQWIDLAGNASNSQSSGVTQSIATVLLSVSRRTPAAAGMLV